MGDANEIERRVQNWCGAQEVQCGLTSLAGAWRRAPMVRHNKLSFYVQNKQTGVFGKLLEGLEANRVTSGGNLSLWMTTDPAVFWHMSKYDGVQVVSAIQLYLDLTGHRGRGEESAKEIYDRCLAEPFSRVERGAS